LALLSRLRQGGSANDGTQGERATAGKDEEKGGEGNEADDVKAVVTQAAVANDPDAPDDMFMTDREITARSQQEKLSILPPTLSGLALDGSQPETPAIGEDLAWMIQWARGLPNAVPTREFGDFRVQTNLVLDAMMTAAAAP